ncbi:hypothetical protein RJD24_18625 [Bacillaceae bacterium IKA-2]|nr:hypothetical protein RJD24_18625 [Bacillaceae bacterium IKA-2]
MSVKVSVRVKHNGKIYMPEEVIEKILEKEAKRLVDSGDAIFMQTFETEKQPEGDKNSDGGNADGTSFEGIEIEDLKAAAKEAGVTFNTNIGLEKLIERIKEEEKTEAVLSQFDDGDE